MRPRHALSFALATFLLATFAGGATAETWPSWDGVATGLAGESTIVAGEFIATDHLHFARGPDTDGLAHEDYFRSVLLGGDEGPAPAPREDDDVYRHLTWGAFGADRSAHNGDFVLPTDRERWPDHTADIHEVRLAVHGGDLYVRIRFLSFPDPAAQVATLTLAGAAAAVATWPRDAGVASPWDTAITIWGSGAEVVGAGGARDLVAIGGAHRVTDHAFEVRVPLDELPAGPWTVNGGAGLADPADPTRYWVVPAGDPSADAPGTGSGNAPGANVWDLAFEPPDEVWFDDHAQATALTTGDVSGMGITVDPAALAAGVTSEPTVRTGRVARSHTSAFDLGDGITRSGGGSPPAFPFGSPPPFVPDRDFAVSYTFLDAVTPYFAYVPRAYPSSTGDWPLIVYLHGANNYPWEPFGLTLGLEEELEARGYLFASALGRGDTASQGIGEVDALEVIADMSRRYRVDADRIYLMGHSNGSRGTLFVSTRNPDVFAAVAPAQIPSSVERAENLRHVPVLHTTGLQDPLDPGIQAQEFYDAVSGLGYDAQLLAFDMKTHEGSSIYDALDLIFDLFDRSVRDPDPAEVVYRRIGGDLDPDLGLLHDGAYWVDDLVAADPAVDVVVRATSFALPYAPLDPDAATRTTEFTDTGGPSGRATGLLSVTTPAFGPVAESRNGAHLVLQNATEVTLDVTRMALDLQRPARIDTDLSHDVDLTLSSVPASRVSWTTRDGSDGVLTSGEGATSAGAVTIAVPGGAASVEFEGRFDDVAVPPVPAPPPLPTTGGGTAGAVALVLVVALGSSGLRRRRFA